MIQGLDLLEVLRFSPHATAIYDTADIRIAFANDAMLNIWCAPRSIMGKYFRDIFPSFTNEGFASILENVWRSGITYKANDTAAVIVDGDEKCTRYFDFEYRALLDEQGNTYAILHTAKDVTQKQVVLSQLLLQQKQKEFNDDLETLTHTLSHDIMNPLSTAKMGIAFLQRRSDIPIDNRSKWYDTIGKALHSMENMIIQTTKLSEARSIANITKVIDLTYQIPLWCKESQDLFNNQQCEIILGELLPVYGDMGAIHQIFSNIICNAVKYTVHVENPKVEVYSEKTDKGTVYYIKDNGIGISAVKLENIFCLSSAEKKLTRSTKVEGLGLCLTKRIIERYGGTVNVSSVEGKGTIVRLYFVDPVELP